MILTKQKLLFNKTLALWIVALFSSVLFLTNQEVEAATAKPTTGSIEYSLLDDDGKTFVQSKDVVFQNLSVLEGDLVDYKSIWGYNSLQGLVTVPLRYSQNNLIQVNMQSLQE